MKENETEIGSYRFDIKCAEEKLSQFDAEKILLQLPDGFKPKADRFVGLFEQKVTVWGGSCYGACDLPGDIGDSDVLINVGHAEISYLKKKYPIIYLEGRCSIWNDLPDELLERLDGKIALYAPVQHLHHLERAAENIEDGGDKAVIGEGDDRIKYPGQILGCNYSVKEEEADHHLYIGTGRFHPLGLSFSLGKDVLIYNPLSREVDRIGEEERDSFLRKRYGAIAQVKDAEKVMVITSTKPGQVREKLAKDILDAGRKADKKMIPTRFDEISPELVDQFMLDCAVCTACPRIALDDADRFKTIMLTPREFKMGLEIGSAQEWEIDEIK
ncbi:MAG: diphthamide biosynthesis enzyme Dph2 [Candidatus Aenigmatarchaeota archaeon]